MSIHVASVDDDESDGIRPDDPLVVDSLSPGDRLLLLGSALKPIEQGIRRLLTANEDESGVVVVSTRKLLSDSQLTVADRAAISDRRRGAVDGPSNDPRERRAGHDRDRRVPFSTELTGIEIAVTRRLADLRRRGIDRPWLVVDTPSPLFGSLDSSTLVRFCHSLASTVEHYGGIGCYVANDAESTDGHLDRLKHLSNGTLAIRTTGGGYEVRRRGFGDRDGDWQAFGGEAPGDTPERLHPEAE
ncbi:MAG TPA: hypothetical protein VJ898_09435 [Natrialbaceae archaeon]|nr:hypothetical protein [Natrialbaceae archaeon]